MSLRFPLLFLLLVLQVRAEENKMNLFLHQSIEKGQNKPIDVLVQGDISAIRSWSDRNGGSCLSTSGDIAWLRLSVLQLPLLHACPFVHRIEAYPENVRPMNDTMRYLTRTDLVHDGIWLPQAYKGSGIILGYIDSGIDVDHPDFQDSLGHTRVKWLWDMTLPVAANTPQPFGYGQEWDQTQIDAGLSAAHTGQQEYGHGTYVTGIGSGNGRALGHFTGVAPESDIIVVNYDFAANDNVPRVAHAVEYIFSKASQLGKPCVINASLGDYYGSHDGRDLESQYISNLIDQQQGRVLVAAAGNIGVNYPFHIGKDIQTGDTSFTWFKFNPSFGAAYAQIFADSVDMWNMRFNVSVDKVSPNYESRASLPWRSIFNVTSGVVTNVVTVNGNRIGIVQMLGTNLGGVYSLEVYVTPDSTDYNWRLSLTGNGRYDGWDFDWVFQNLPAPAVFPPMANYLAPDTLQSIVSGFACLDNVITVGNYYNTDRHVDVNGTLQIAPSDLPRQLAENSSRGPTRDGRIKPDICAPGHHILSAGVLTLMPGMIAAQPYKVALGGQHITGGGTSASAPVVAGIAALYLEKNPGAGWQDVKNALTACAGTDQYTAPWGPLPNNAWGYGKADALSTLLCSVTGLPASPDEFSGIVISPNPAVDFMDVSIPDFRFTGDVPYEILSSNGQSVRKGRLTSSSERIELKGLATGKYVFRLLSEMPAPLVKTFVVAR
ncbi:MAG: S8 family serine peptidase [Bacteroidota bacterium]